MSETQKLPDNPLVGLVQAGKLEELEKRWASEVAEAAEPRPDLLAALDAVIKVGNTAAAEALALQWLEARRTAVGDTADPFKVRPLLGVCRELLLRIDNAEFRRQAEQLYRRLHAGLSFLDAALSASGLNPPPEQKKSHPRKALRLLDGMFGLAVGSFLVRRGEDRMGEVTDIDPGTAVVTVRTSKGTELLTPSDIADIWEAAHPEDFRVLEQLRPARLTEMARDNPAALVTAVLRARGGKTDAAQLKKLLSPKHISAKDYDGWWTKVRNALKRDPFIRMEGRAPVTLTLEAAGRTFKQETADAFKAAKTVEAKIESVGAYLRECERRKEVPDRELIELMRGEVSRLLRERLAKASDDLAASLMLDKLEGETAGTPPGAGHAAKVLREARDPMPLFRRLDDDDQWNLALVVAQAVFADSWVPKFIELLPTTPPKVCDAIVARLLEAGHVDLVKDVVNRIFNKPTTANLPGLLWLWKGPSQADKIGVPSKPNLFTKIIHVLEVLGAREGKTDEETRNAKNLIKSALSARNNEDFREAIVGADLGLAAVIRRQVERCEALGPSLRDDLVGILREEFKEMFKVAKLPAWEDTSVIWTTEAGLKKKQAEYEELINVKMPANARAIAAAREHGDLRENADYQAAMEERDLLRARQAEMQRDLNIVRVLSPNDIPVDKVGIGSKVTLVNTADGSVHEVTLLGPWDADRERNIFPYRVPMYKPLFGQKVGETLELSLHGHAGTYRIDKIERGQIE